MEHLRQPVVLLKISASDADSEMFSELDTGIRIFSVSSGSVSLASFCFRLSLDERFHRIPAQKNTRSVNTSCTTISELNTRAITVII